MPQVKIPCFTFMKNKKKRECFGKMNEKKNVMTKKFSEQIYSKRASQISRKC